MDNLKIVIIGAGWVVETWHCLRQAGVRLRFMIALVNLPSWSGISLWSNGVKVLNR